MWASLKYIVEMCSDPDCLNHFWSAYSITQEVPEKNHSAATFPQHCKPINILSLFAW